MTAAPSGPIRNLGIFGAGKSGVAIARRALAAGYTVRIATSGPPERTRLVTGILTPGAIATDTTELTSASDVVILAVPLRRFRELPLHTMRDVIVIDVMNYWPPIDGVLTEFEYGNRPSSAIVAEALPAGSHLVKTLNHIGYHEIEDLARPAATPGRVALGLAGDDAEAIAAVARFVDDLGFEPVPSGSLAASTILQPGAPIFGADLEASALRHLLGRDASDGQRSVQHSPAGSTAG